MLVVESLGCLKAELKADLKADLEADLEADQRRPQREERTRGYSSAAEPQPSKLMTRVRFPLPAPVVVSLGETRSEAEQDNAKLREAHIAQSVEHFLGKEEVIGSNPIVSTIFRPFH